MTNEIYKKIQDEMTLIWYYLSTYVELYDHPDPNRAEVIQSTAPAFFTVVQAALGETILLRIARLLDPKESCGEPNLSLEQLNDRVRDSAQSRFKKTKDAWKNGKYLTLKDYRNKIIAHNDLDLKLNDPSRNLPLMDDIQIKLIRELYQELWDFLKLAHKDLYNTALIEPTFGSSIAFPQNIFLSLRTGLYLEKEHEFPPRNWEDFKFKHVGKDTPLRIVK